MSEVLPEILHAIFYYRFPNKLGSSGGADRITYLVIGLRMCVPMND